MIRVLRLIAVLLALAVPSASAWAQGTGIVSGLVTDQATGQGVSGVQVSVVGTNVSTITNQAGNYLLPNVLAGPRLLRVNVLGYTADDTRVTVRAGETVRANIELRVSAVQLDEVVVSAVTGRVERKRELGTNTASISARDLELKPITKMSDVLTARAAGVQLQGVNGSVGTSQRIRIRGANSISLSNDPLIFVDGVQFSNSRGGFGVGGQDYSRFNDLNPEDIANIEILKGPAASALYGTAAANGVILITTKRGQSGGAQWHAYTEYGISQDKTQYPLNFLPYQVNNASAALFTARGNLNTSATAGAPYTFCPLYAAGTVKNLANSTCAQQVMLKLNPFETAGLDPFSTGQRNKYGLSVSGGSDVVTYYMSGDLDAERGVISFNKQDRMNLRTNVGARVRDDLGLNVNAGYTRTSLWLNSNDNNVFSPLINGLLATPQVPTQAQRDSSPAGARWGTGFGHYLSDIRENLSQQVVDRFIIGASTNYTPLSWLTFNANIGMDYFGRNDGNTVQPGRLPISSSYTAGFRASQRNSNYIWTSNAAGVGTFNLRENLRSTTTVGGSFSREQFESTYCYGVGIVEGTSSCSATSSLFSVAESYTENRTIGAYVQEQLNWRDKLIVAASIRGDDNSAFGQSFGFITYPGVSASWMASQESFFPRIPGLSNLRLRASYGQSGQRPGPRDAVTLYGSTSASVGNQELSAVRLTSVGNLDLKPERTTEYEAGFDAGLLRDRIALEFTYFQKKSMDALISKPLPPSFGLTGDGGGGSIYDNLGSVKNWGTELALNTRAFASPKATLNLRLSASTLHNEILDLGEKINPIIFNRGNQRHADGQPTGAFFGRRYKIVNPDQHRILTPADVIMIDDTATTIGPMLPTNTQTVSADLSLFRNLVTLSALLDRRAGNKQLNYTEYFRCNTGYANALGNAARGNCAAATDPNASNWDQARWLAVRFGATDSKTGKAVSTSAGYIEDADFIKLREVSLTVAVPRSLSQRVSLLQGASVTFSGRNLGIWTDYTGLDPEINESGGGANFTQGEFNTQPPLRYYTVRFNFAF